MEKSQSAVKLVLAVLTVFLLALQTSQASSTVKVSFEGCVEYSKTIAYDSKVTLFQVIQNAQLTDCVYMLGAAWQSKALLATQNRQKQSLISTIDQLIKLSEQESDIEYLAKLKKMIASQSVTGRVVGVDLEPFHVEILPLKNRVITSDASLSFPKQPMSINLIGFNVDSHSYDSGQSITDIYRAYDICDSCTHGKLWLVQPNGEISKKRVGFWTNEKFYLAPGGWLISPIENSDYDEIEPNFSQKLAEWLATQVVK